MILKIFKNQLFYTRMRLFLRSFWIKSLISKKNVIFQQIAGISLFYIYT